MPDSISDDITTTGTIAVGVPVFGVIETSGDEDWYRVTLKAGLHYYVNLTGDTTGLMSTLFPAIAVHDGLGSIVAESDPRPFGQSAFLDLVVATDGDYFIAAQDQFSGSFVLSIDRNIPETISTGAFLQWEFPTTGHISASQSFDDNWYRVEVPDYLVGTGLIVQLTKAGLSDDLQSGYLQLFDAQGQLLATGTDVMPLAMLQAGTYYVSVGGLREGDNGYYDIGYGPLLDMWETPVKSVDWGYSVDSGDGQPVTIDVFFGAGGVEVDDTEGEFTSQAWTTAERAAAMAAFTSFEKVANITFRYVTDPAEAEFLMLKNPDTPHTGIVGNLGYWNVGGGVFYDGTYTGIGVGVFNSKGTGWTNAGLKQGGYGYITLIHEIGHGLGLKHPHDHGGGDGPVMDGVDPGDSEDLGDFSLNQGIYTMMSYNDGWQTQPGVGASGSDDYGWEGSPMALDIAQLQLKYGAAANATGNSTYTLRSVDKAGTMFRTIWDTAGVDTMRYQGSKDAFISLKAATLDYSASGGGPVSYVKGVHGGFTIAYGVWIENAVTGSGNDWLQGSLRANLLDGGAGIDTADYSDRGRQVSVRLKGADDADVTIDGKLEDRLRNIENLVGGTASDKLYGDALANSLAGGFGKDELKGFAGNDRFVFDARLAANNVDTILDFRPGHDLLVLDRHVFKTIGSSLTSTEFYARAGASAAHDSSDRIIYNRTSGQLLYDDDGNKAAGHAAILFATLATKPAALDFTDFVIA